MPLDAHDQLVVDLITLSNEGPQALEARLPLLDEALRHDSERVRAAATAVVEAFLDDRLVPLLTAVVEDEALDAEIRADAAICLSPLLEQYDMHEDLYAEAEAETIEAYEGAMATLADLYGDLEAPKVLRRRALEAAIRAPGDWQRAAVLSAWRSDDLEWRITAVFCMGLLSDFDELLIEALDEDEPLILREALRAAAVAELDEAASTALWAAARHPDRWVRVAAIGLLGQLAPQGAFELLTKLRGDADSVVAEAAEESMEALLMREEVASELALEVEEEDADEDDEWI